MSVKIHNKFLVTEMGLWWIYVKKPPQDEVWIEELEKKWKYRRQ
jgi:hypothetical protein